MSQSTAQAKLLDEPVDYLSRLAGGKRHTSTRSASVVTSGCHPPDIDMHT
jgi:hypothetical protein